MLRPAAIDQRHAGGGGAIWTESLGACYGAVWALDEVSVMFRAGSVTALIGPNGAGKSTLLDVLAGVRRPAVGAVRGRAERKVAYVLQRSSVADTFPLTVRQAVAMGRWQRRRLVRRLRGDDWMVVDEAMLRLGIEPLARRQVGELSGGQRQRVLVAQGLAQRADLLLLDEPVTGLDIAAREQILGVIDGEAAHGTTVVYTTHDLTDVGRADQVVLLSGGRVAAAGDPDDVVRVEVVADAYGLVATGHATVS